MPDRLNINSPLQQRRLLREAQHRADEALRAAKRHNRSPHHQIDLAFRRQAHGLLSRWVAGVLEHFDRKHHRALRELLTHLANCRSPLLDEREYVVAMGALARYCDRWISPIDTWMPRTHNAGRQFSSLVRHLLARYPVPRFFDAAWLDSAGEHACNEREWFIHIGAGQNLRTASGLPFALTKMMAHQVLLAPDDLSVPAALRWGQVRGLGGGARLADVIAATRLRMPQSRDAEEFWLTVIQFFVANPMLDPHQIGPIVDYLQAQRFEAAPPRIVNGVAVPGGIPQPNLAMKGRTVASLLRHVHGWHRQLARAAGAKDLWWPTCGIAGYERVEGTPGNQRLFTFVELRTGRELIDEGRAMSHCVASYAHSCAKGRSAIFSLREDRGSGLERRLTVEVTVQNRRIVQARGRHNTPPGGIDDRLLRAWAVHAGLTVPAVGRM